MTTQLPKYNITDMQTRYKVVEALISENFWNENTINSCIGEFLDSGYIEEDEYCIDGNSVYLDKCKANNLEILDSIKSYYVHHKDSLIKSIGKKNTYISLIIYTVSMISMILKILKLFHFKTD